ncbi:hypothetical protein DRH27_03215 [Candidatus Falkowbacteria bacterium]|nr:MAG: hypothetical protein DRH27_03215 [Candidatus Falkowbacteria bacterium]
MIKRTIKFVHNLRIYFFVLILVSFFYYAGLNPVDISRFVGAKIGSAVGMSISVQENPFNKLALQLKEKEENLTQKEKDLAQRENALNAANSPQIKLVFFLAVGITVLFILVLINFYFDYKRKRRELSSKQ